MSQEPWPPPGKLETFPLSLRNPRCPRVTLACDARAGVLTRRTVREKTRVLSRHRVCGHLSRQAPERHVVGS